jgi:DNA invertase Pin-like site-specific DNA recombinase
VRSLIRLRSNSALCGASHKAEFERDLIRTRTGEGRERAKARGQRMGRPPKLTPHQQKEAIKRRDRGEESLTEIGRSYNVSAATISRLAS